MTNEGPQPKRLTEDEVGAEIRGARVLVAKTKNYFARRRDRTLDVKKQRSNELLSLIATTDRWTVGYGAGLLYLSIEEFGILDDVGLIYRAIAGMLTISALILLGVDKILRREAVRAAEQKLDSMYEDLRKRLDALEADESILDFPDYISLRDRFDNAKLVTSRTMSNVEDWDYKIAPEEILASELMSVLKKRLDLWCLVLLVAGTLALIAGAVHHFVF